MQIKKKHIRKSKKSILLSILFLSIFALNLGIEILILPNITANRNTQNQDNKNVPTPAENTQQALPEENETLPIILFSENELHCSPQIWPNFNLCNISMKKHFFAQVAKNNTYPEDKNAKKRINWVLAYNSYEIFNKTTGGLIFINVEGVNENQFMTSAYSDSVLDYVRGQTLRRQDIDYLNGNVTFLSYNKFLYRINFTLVPRDVYVRDYTTRQYLDVYFKEKFGIFDGLLLSKTNTSAYYSNHSDLVQTHNPFYYNANELSALNIGDNITIMGKPFIMINKTSKYYALCNYDIDHIILGNESINTTYYIKPNGKFLGVRIDMKWFTNYPDLYWCFSNQSSVEIWFTNDEYVYTPLPFVFNFTRPKDWTNTIVFSIFAAIGIGIALAILIIVKKIKRKKLKIKSKESEPKL